MLPRFIPKPSLLYRVLTLTGSPTYIVNSKPILRNHLYSIPNHYVALRTPHFSLFSTKGKKGGDDSATSTTDLWKIYSEDDEDIDSLFSVGAGDLQGIDGQNGGPVKNDNGKIGDPFGGSEGKDSDFGSNNIFSGVERSGGGEEGAPEDFKPWSLTEEGKEGAEEDMFGVVTDGVEIGVAI